MFLESCGCFETVLFAHFGLVSVALFFFNSATVGVSAVERAVWDRRWCHALLVSRKATRVTRGARSPAGCSPRSRKPSSRNPRRGEMGMG